MSSGGCAAAHPESLLPPAQIKSHAFSLHSARVDPCDLSLGIVDSGHCAPLDSWSATKPSRVYLLDHRGPGRTKLSVAAPESLGMAAVWSISFADAQIEQ